MDGNKNNLQLDSGFEEIKEHKLDAGFEEVPNERSTLVESKPVEFSALDTAARTLSGDITFGLDKKLAGVLGAGMDRIAGVQPEKSLKELYEEYKTAYRQDTEKAQQQNPMVAAGTSIASLAIPSPTSALKIGKLGKLGVDAGLGALASYNVNDSVSDAAKSGALNLGLGTLVRGLGKLGKSGKALEMGAEGETLLSKKTAQKIGQEYENIAKSAANKLDLTPEVDTLLQKIDKAGLRSQDESRILDKLNKIRLGKEVSAEEVLEFRKDLNRIFPELGKDAQEIIGNIKPNITDKLQNALPEIKDLDKRYQTAKAFQETEINPLSILRNPVQAIASKGILPAANIAGGLIGKRSQIQSAVSNLEETDKIPKNESFDKQIATAAKAPSEVLKIGAEKLKQSNNQVLQSLGESLIQGVDSADMYKKNAALFAIMQNPTARELLGIGEKKQ